MPLTAVLPRRRRAVVAGVVALVTGVGAVLASGTSAARATPTVDAVRTPAAPAAPVVGATGVGDGYWPLDGNGGIDVRHYDIDVAYDFGTGRLTGTTIVRLRPLADLSRFHLDLLLTATGVTVDGVPADFGKVGSHELEVTPAVALVEGVAVEVVVAYEGEPGPIAYAGERNWLASDDEVVTMNEPHMAPWWFPANDHPSDKALFDITVTGPATHQVVSNGLLVDRTVDAPLATTHWRSAHPMTSYLAFFALGRYRIEQTTRGGLPSYIAVSKELPDRDRRISLQAMRGSDEVTAWLERRLGRYPFESTGGLVTSLPVQFALENQTRPTYPAFQGAARSLVVHELAHQWFGDSVSVRRWRDIWLAEGFATFMEVASLEDRGGRTGRTWLRAAYADRHDDREFWRIDLTDPGAHRIFANAVYDRGAMTLQALRNRVGDRPFWRLLRTWVARERYGNATVGDFRRLAEEVAGEQLDGFFHAWLEGRRPPERSRANGLR